MKIQGIRIETKDGMIVETAIKNIINMRKGDKVIRVTLVEVK